MVLVESHRGFLHALHTYEDGVILLHIGNANRYKPEGFVGLRYPV